MGRRYGPLGLMAALLLTGCGAGPRGAGSVGMSTSLECAPFARQVSGIQLYGEAYS